MSIKSHVYYNKATGAMDGFVSYGEGIIAFDEETVAKEALVFMLVGSMQSDVLIDDITSNNLQCLIMKAIKFLFTK